MDKKEEQFERLKESTRMYILASRVLIASLSKEITEADEHDYAAAILNITSGISNGLISALNLKAFIN